MQLADGSKSGGRGTSATFYGRGFGVEKTGAKAAFVFAICILLLQVTLSDWRL